MDRSSMMIEVDAAPREAPGTMMLKDLQGSSKSIILHPVPTSDPNDPLNWSKYRKATNYTLAAFFVFFTFVTLNVIFIPFAEISADLAFTYSDFTTAVALIYTGLATGSILFIPLLHKYGRRPIYILSCGIQFAAAIWLSEMRTKSSFIGANFVSGFGGALSETILQVTIVDLFFVHQHATMSGIFLMDICVASGLGPVAAGYVVLSEGWRWIWRWCAIFLGVNFILVCFFFEESKYIPLIVGERHGIHLTAPKAVDTPKDGKEAHGQTPHDAETVFEIPPKMKSYRQRLALITKTEGSVGRHFYQPFIILFTYPAVTYTAITYGALNAWYSVIVSVVDSTVIYPPYNFSSAGVGLLTLGVTVGCVLGTLLAGPLNDSSVIWLSKRNGGKFEPEMRLYMSLPISILAIGGILMVGLGLAHNVHWAIIAIGYAVFGFAYVVIGNGAITYVTDTYQDIIGDALVAVTFVRNGIAIAVQFALSPWLTRLGIQNLFICVAMICLALLLLPIPMIIWGKKARFMTGARYKELASSLPSHRVV